MLRAEANAETLKGQRITELISPKWVILSSRVPKAQRQSQKREEKNHKKEDDDGDLCMGGRKAHETSFLAEELLAVDWCLERKNTFSSGVWALIGYPDSSVMWECHI